MADISTLQSRFNALLANISPSARKKLATEISKSLAKTNSARIKAQKNIDGSSYEPRKPRKIKSKKGKIKTGAMFNKIRTARFMKRISTSDTAQIRISGNAGYIATRHQYGNESFVDKGEKIKIKYPQREILGMTDEDLKMIEELLINHLSLSR